MMVGASGGAKWLVLAGLDKALIREIVPRYTAPVHLLGSSIGAWRFSCYAQSDPMAALARFERAYLTQTYSEKPDRAEITRVSGEILGQVDFAGVLRDLQHEPVVQGVGDAVVAAAQLRRAEPPAECGCGLGHHSTGLQYSGQCRCALQQ